MTFILFNPSVYDSVFKNKSTGVEEVLQGSTHIAEASGKHKWKTFTPTNNLFLKRGWSYCFNEGKC